MKFLGTANSFSVQPTGLSTRTPVADAAYTALATDRVIAYTSLSAARAVTLLAASAYPIGTQLLVVDESGSCSATKTITLTRAGSDTINGATSAVIAIAYGYIAIESNGSNKWTIVDLSTASMAQQAANAVAITGGSVNGTTIGATTPAAGSFTNVSAAGSVASTGSNSGFFAYDRSSSPTNGTFVYRTGDVNYFGDYTGSTLTNVIYFSASSISLGTATTVVGTLSASSVAISGGSINATSIGATTASTVKGTVVAATTSLNLPSYTVATLPAAGTAGREVFCSNARMQTATAGTLETMGSGTGGTVTDNGSAWRISGTNITASA